MYEIRDLRMMLAIHENGSLARAARVLGVAQPVLTRQLSALETRVRGRLFERNSRGALPTDLGQAIIRQADGILELLDDLNKTTAEARGHQTAELVIAAGAYMAETLCLIAASRMVRDFPLLRIRLLSTNWSEVPRLIHDREAAVGVFDVRSMPDDPGLELERLRPHPGFFVVRPEHPLVARPSISLDDIVAYPMAFIGRAPSAIQTPLATARGMAREHGASHPAFPALIHESPTVALGALRHSDLVAAVTPPIASAAVLRGEVVVLPWRAPWLSVHPGVVRLRSRGRSEAEAAFLDLLRDIESEIEKAAIAFCTDVALSACCDV